MTGIAQTEGAAVNDSIAIGGNRDDAGDIPAVNSRLQPLVEPVNGCRTLRDEHEARDGADADGESNSSNSHVRLRFQLRALSIDHLRTVHLTSTNDNTFTPSMRG